MLRSRPLARSLQPFLCPTRFVATSPPSTAPSSDKTPSPLPPPPPPRKPKVGLRPAPVKPPPPKPSTFSAHHVPLSPSRKPTPPAHASAPSLNQVKETAKHDIEQAEAHGILSPPPPNANWFKRTVHKGIQLAKFYFRGIKLIFVRSRQVSQIRSRVRSGGSPMTRAEFRFIQTQKKDINKVIPFVIIALLLEEVIPLIAIYAPSLLPSTCILPSQQERIQEEKIQKALSSRRNHAALLTELRSKESPESYLSIDAIRSQDAPSVFCGLLGLTVFGFDALRIHRIRRHLSFLAEDDHFLLQDQSQLSQKELMEALKERGLVDPQASLKSNEAKLQWWLNNIRSSDPADALARRLSLIIQHSSGARPL
ncbi:hypothetical protein AGABI2DRAFT_192547 [Agaricus bisporus var. bisporus H97]|uniref:hypothetical protein n=1 Tax=Agaricus bisporus var. bisporus (strain H97 / ATCC MYA-4626 / FGSC 10389) TaxID=936046 RepID=UPI00029F62AA|nr:hypothetical protein AGABI2DRAFT_192547 [Agaricus bisporus var. bisporus H97]EKV47321.1 hypothetical protein AGABI2DRAFT_192547 [Agaricus bisporus var. bisporus H97]